MKITGRNLGKRDAIKQIPNLAELQIICHEIAKSKGWHDDEIGNDIPKMLINISGEIAEAWEEVRMPFFNPHNISLEGDGKPKGFPVELADALIRILDTVGALGIEDFWEVVMMKCNYNKTRSFRHGGERA